MIVGALLFVQTLVVVLERQARPTGVDPAFYVEVQQAQFSRGSRFVDSGHRPGTQTVALRTP
jgi:hypothetical protein